MTAWHLVVPMPQWSTENEPEVRSDLLVSSFGVKEVVQACEKHGVNADFYIKTFHHHSYPTAPKADEESGR